VRKIVEIALSEEQQEQVQKYVEYMNTEGRCDGELWDFELAIAVIFSYGLDDVLKRFSCAFNR